MIDEKRQGKGLEGDYSVTRAGSGEGLLLSYSIRLKTNKICTLAENISQINFKVM